MAVNAADRIDRLFARIDEVLDVGQQHEGDEHGADHHHRPHIDPWPISESWWRDLPALTSQQRDALRRVWDR